MLHMPAKSGAAGLMIIPRVLSRGISPIAQEVHFSAILEAGGDLTCGDLQ